MFRPVRLAFSMLVLGLWAAPPVSAGSFPVGVPVAQLDGAASCNPRDVSLASTPDGFLAAWISATGLFRAFDEQRTAKGPEEVLFGGFSTGARLTTVATTADGSGVVVALQQGTGKLFARAVDPLGRLVPNSRVPLGTIAGAEAEDIELALTALDDGSFLLADNRTAFASRFSPTELLGSVPLGADGGSLDLLQVGDDLWLAYTADLPTSPPSTGIFLEARRLPDGRLLDRILTESVPGTVSGVALAEDDRGRVSLAWADGSGVRLQRFDDSGTPLGPALSWSHPTEFGPIEDIAVVADAEGNRLVTWATVAPLEGDSAVFTQAVLADDTEAGPTIRQFEFPSDLVEYFDADAALSGPSVATVVSTIPGVTVPILEPGCIRSLGLSARRVNLGDERHLLLRDGRFRVEVDWQNPFGDSSGIGHAVPGTTDAGSFWFFSPDTKEIEIKILDGRGINGHFWIFAAGLSNVGYQITVTDQRTGLSKTYDNPPRDFGNFIDTTSFPGE